MSDQTCKSLHKSSCFSMQSSFLLPLCVLVFLPKQLSQSFTGKPQISETTNPGGGHYAKAGITNEDDFRLREQLDAADRLIQEDPSAAGQEFEKILLENPRSPRALYGKARSLDRLADKKQSNSILEKAIDVYAHVVLQAENVPNELYRLAGNRCVERMQFRGWSAKATKILKVMLTRFPDDVNLLNSLGTQYLLIGQNEAAKNAFETVLSLNSLNNYAALHLGFILKTNGKLEDDLNRGVNLLLQGIQGSPATEGKFYYHLGEGLRRLGREEEADIIYERAVEKGIFKSFWQRSLYNLEGLRAQPVWPIAETGQKVGLTALRDNWRTIRNEALSLLNANGTAFQPETENLRDTGDWKQFELFRQGRESAEGCRRAPRTCHLVRTHLADSAATNKRGQVKFSVMSGGTHVHPHSGPTNCRLRGHLALKVPQGPGRLEMRVADQLLTWKEGEIWIFDDSYDHEVWNERDGERVVLIVDIWHPDIDESSKSLLAPI